MSKSNALPNSNLVHVGVNDQGHYSIVIEFSELPERTNNSAKNNWALLRKQKLRWKMAVARLVYYVRPSKPLTKAKLTMTRFSSSQCDFDGLVSSFKPLIDGLVQGRILEDDNMKVIGQPDYSWEKTKPGQGRVRVEVYET